MSLLSKEAARKQLPFRVQIWKLGLKATVGYARHNVLPHVYIFHRDVTVLVEIAHNRYHDYFSLEGNALKLIDVRTQKKKKPVNSI